jgi:hypothetical protein
MLGMSRGDAEQGLARALSRHIGYTSGAYDLPRIFSVVEYFRTRTSAYTEEIVNYLAANSGTNPASAGYLAEVISFASSFGIIEAVSNRETKLTRYAATELGRSVLGSSSLDDGAFRRFFVTDVVMLADADFLIPLMLHIDSHVDTPLIDYFCAFAEELRTRRYDWMRAAFPQPILLERVASRIAWLKKAKGGLTRYKVDVPTKNTARHHSAPRIGWLVELGLVDRDRQALTQFGTDMLHALVENRAYFWVGPDPEALAALALSEPMPSASETDLRLSAGRPPATDAQVHSVAKDAAAMMTRAFRDAKLIHADQASLRLPIAYIQYRSYKDQCVYDWRTVLDTIFDDNRETLRRYSAHKGHVGFYKLSVA